jgi:Protein of unknown function (DUF1566)/Carboxypeptidase regulatory-like domain/Divergent InlB B-repeat domain
LFARLLFLTLLLCAMLPTTVRAGICTDNGNGTLSDTSTGLIWLKDASCLGSTDWSSAIVSATSLASGNCGLTDGSRVGEWHLPTKEELDSLIRGTGVPQMICSGDLCSNYTSTGENPNVWLTSQGFTAVQTGYYWTSTPLTSNTGFAWTVGMNYGIVNNSSKISLFNVWPVRSGSSITGTVVDAATTLPLAGTTITIGTLNMQTDVAGTYRATLAPGNYIVTAARSGYESPSVPVTTSTGQSAVQNFSLKPLIPLSISFTGTGSGSVTDTTAGISCGSNCQTSVVWNTLLNLAAAPRPYSLFTGWDGSGCTGTGTCSVTVTTPASVLANFSFDAVNSVRQDAAPFIFYPSLQNAFDHAPTSALLRAWATTYTEGLNLTRALSLKVFGGYSQDYTSQTGVTTIVGLLRIASGSLVADRVAIR